MSAGLSGMGDGGDSDQESIQNGGSQYSTEHTFGWCVHLRRNKYISYRRVSTRGHQHEARAITVFLCGRYKDALGAGGPRQIRRREDQPKCRVSREMSKNLIDLWAFGIIVIPTFDKELPEILRYAYFAGVGWDRGPFTLDDLVYDLRVPHTVKRHQSTQHLNVTLRFSMPPDTSEDENAPVEPPLRTHKRPPPSTPGTWLSRTCSGTTILEP